jgi:hypothetical protein
MAETPSLDALKQKKQFHERVLRLLEVKSLLAATEQERGNLRSQTENINRHIAALDLVIAAAVNK